MTARNAAQIATLIGILLDVENGDTDGIICAPHLQVKVKVDTSKPLAPGFLFPRSGRSPIWVQFLYERLADYCVLYGLVDHRQNFCPAPPPQGPEDKYGISLRAFFFFFFYFRSTFFFGSSFGYSGASYVSGGFCFSGAILQHRFSWSPTFAEPTSSARFSSGSLGF
jgi:hypothetical protein